MSLFTIRIYRRGHAADDLPRAVRANPCVSDSQSVGPDLGAFAIGPGCIDPIVVDRDISGYLNGELLNRVRLELDTLRSVRSDPVGDVILSHRLGTDKWPANKILVPQAAIL